MIGRSVLNEKFTLSSHFSKSKLYYTRAVIATHKKGQKDDAEAELAREIQLVKNGQAECIITRAYAFLQIGIEQFFSLEGPIEQARPDSHHSHLLFGFQMNWRVPLTLTEKEISIHSGYAMEKMAQMKVITLSALAHRRRFLSTRCLCRLLRQLSNYISLESIILQASIIEEYQIFNRSLLRDICPVGYENKTIFGRCLQKTFIIRVQVMRNPLTFSHYFFIIFQAMFVLNSQPDQQSQTVVEVRQNKTAGESVNPSQRKTSTIVVKFSAQDAKKFIVSREPNSKGIKMKLPLKLKLSSDPADPSSRLKARLVLDQDALDKEFRQESNQAVPKNGTNLKSQPTNQPQLTSLAVQASQGQTQHSAIPLEEIDDFFTEVPPSEQPFNSPWKSLCDFFLAINEQLSCKPGYSTVLDSELIEKMQLELTHIHFNFQQMQQLLSLILDYLALSKNYSHRKQEIQPLPTRLQLRNFAEVLGADWRHLKEQVFAYNKNILKVLDYIHPKCQGEGSRYTHCYFNLKFDMSYEQVESVAEAVKYQCRYNSKAFCFLTNYLLTSCLHKEKMQNACIRHIESTLASTINKLIKDHPPSYSIQGGTQLICRHYSFKVDPSKYPTKILNLRNVPPHQKIAVLQKFIQLRAKEAQLNSGAFARLIKDVGSRSGSNLSTGVKIKSMRKRRAIERVKEKVLDGISQKHRAELLLDVNPNHSVNDYTDAEFQQYKHHINEIFLSLDEPIQFGVDDLLRGRCMFSSLDSLNNCCQELKEEIPKRGYILLSLKNRLINKQCDIVMHIKIGETIAEVQLVLNYKLAHNQFCSNLQHLQRALFYNHITHLKNTNQKLTYLFLEEALSYIRDNTKPCSNKKYNEKTNFKATKQNLEKFIKQLPFKLDRRELNVNEIELPMLAAEVKRFQDISKFPIGNNVQSSEKLKNNGDFLYQLGSYDLSIKNQAHYCHKMEALHHELLYISPQSPQKQFSEQERQIIKNYAGAAYVFGKLHMRAKTYEQAIDYLQRSQRLTQLLGNRDQYYVETWQHLGEIERRRHNLSKASNIYNKVIRFQQSSEKRNSEQYVQSFQALALINQQQTNYEQAIKLLRKIIPIIEKERGKEHIQLATIYNSIGATYNLDGRLAQSLAAYRTSLTIIQREKGKNSVDCASVAANIGLIYETDCNYYEASKYYEQALSICSKHNLKERMYANAAFGLGKCYSELGNFSKAIDNYRKALDYFQKDKGDLFHATNYEIKNAYEALGEDLEPSQLSVEPCQP